MFVLSQKNCLFLSFFQDNYSCIFCSVNFKILIINYHFIEQPKCYLKISLK
uniref:Uncharacterized protein n=1 Tax=Anguilla anguilla TaxID=7936 RepID=A0A0E9SDP8_ANGAN